MAEVQVIVATYTIVKQWHIPTTMDLAAPGVSWFVKYGCLNVETADRAVYEFSKPAYDGADGDFKYHDDVVIHTTSLDDDDVVSFGLNCADE